MLVSDVLILEITILFCFCIGVHFMYNCINMTNKPFTGCILADAMGLGKTLQVIALIWTMISNGLVNKV